MSLENKIEALTLAIEALTASMNLATNEVISLKEPAHETVKPVHDTPTPTATPLKPLKPTVIPSTTDDIKALCLELSRSVSGGKLLAKGILNAAGATKASDVKDSEIEVVMTKLKAEL